jgi:hypothetical protein
VLEGLGFNYGIAQSIAGLYQTKTCTQQGGISCGSGVPGFVWPYGDQPADAVQVQQGWNYQNKVDQGCK